MEITCTGELPAGNGTAAAGGGPGSVGLAGADLGSESVAFPMRGERNSGASTAFLSSWLIVAGITGIRCGGRVE